jgi:hypothetical protein
MKIRLLLIEIMPALSSSPPVDLEPGLPDPDHTLWAIWNPCEQPGCQQPMGPLRVHQGKGKRGVTDRGKLCVTVCTMMIALVLKLILCSARPVGVTGREPLLQHTLARLLRTCSNASSGALPIRVKRTYRHSSGVSLSPFQSTPLQLRSPRIRRPLLRIHLCLRLSPLGLCPAATSAA